MTSSIDTGKASLGFRGQAGPEPAATGRTPGLRPVRVLAMLLLAAGLAACATDAGAPAGGGQAETTATDARRPAGQGGAEAREAEPELAEADESSDAGAEPEPEADPEAEAETRGETGQAGEEGVPEPLKQVTRPDEQLLILEVRLRNYILSDGMFGYLDEGGLILPLGEFARTLEFDVEVDTANGRAGGWFMSPDKLFSVDLLSHSAVIDGRKKEFDAGMVELHREDIFVDTRLLSQWFPVDIEFDTSSQIVKITSREKLPLEQRVERERRRDVALARRGVAETQYEDVETPYRWLSWPMIDFSSTAGFTKDADGESDTSASYNLLAAGDVMKMGSKLFVSGTDRQGVSLVRLEMGRKDPDGELLGPLGATEYVFGDIVTPPLDSIARANLGRGARISSFPLDRTGEFDSVNLVGELLLGWEVELYRNDVLLDFRAARQDGRYEFEEVPLLFGLNVLRLAFFGPQGQRREEVRRVLVGPGQTPPGEFNYRFAVNQQDEYLIPVPDDDQVPDEQQGEVRALMEAEYGVTKNFSLAASASSLALPGGRRSYGSAGVRFGWRGLYTRLDLMGASEGGTAGKVGAQLSMPLNLSLLAEHTELNDFISERFPDDGDPTVRLSKLGLHGVIPFGSLFRVPFSITGEHETKESGDTDTRVRNRISTWISRVSLSNRLEWLRSRNAGIETTNATGSLLVGGRLYRTAVRGELQYGLEPESELTRGILTLERNFSRDTTGRVSADHRFIGDKVTTWSVALSQRFDIVALGLNGAWSDDGAASVFLSLSFALGREPRTGDWSMRSRPIAEYGSASARVFLDNDFDGAFGPDDTPIEGALFDVGRGITRESTNEDGVVLLTGLAPWKDVDVVLPPRGLEDPYWVPRTEGYTIESRPGATTITDFPVVVTGEVDGIVYLRQAGENFEVADVALRLLDESGETVSEVRSAFDGFFLFESVRPGRYTVRVDAGQMQRLNLIASDARTVEIEGDGTIVSGVKFVLQPATGL